MRNQPNKKDLEPDTCLTDRTVEARVREMRVIIDGSPALMEYVGPDCRYRCANRAHERWFGLTPAEVEGMHIRDLLGEEGWLEVRPHVERVLSGEEVTLERIGTTRDGVHRWVRTTLTPHCDESGRVLGFVAHAVDIGERKRADLEREITVEFLRLVNASTDVRGLVEAAVRFLQKRSGCEAVGIRLREGDDYPYIEARGFAQELVRLEVSLRPTDDAGDPRRDAEGGFVLEGLCGAVITGRLDPTKPFATPGGSFWTNSSSEFVATTCQDDLPGCLRGRCAAWGYESIALVPLRVGDERFGLLQLNDRGKGRFNGEVIALWERLAGYLAVALAKLRAEEALRARESELRLIMDATPLLISYVGADYRYRRVNRSYERWFGRRAEDVQGRHVRDIIGEESWPISRPFIERALAGETVTFEREATDLEGARRWLHHIFTPHRDRSGRVMGYVVHVLDVTERKRIEEALRESEGRFRRLAENAQDIVFRYRLHPTRGFEYVSPAATQVVGYTPEEHCADPDLVLKFVHPDDRPPLEERLCSSSPDGFSLAMRCRHKDGHWVWLEQRSVYVFDEEGRAVAMEGIVRDISRQKHLEEELRQAQKLEAIGRLAGGVAHDFNNLLMPIMTYAQLLCRYLKPRSRPYQWAVGLSTAAEKAADLPRQLLAFSRKQIIQPKVLDLNETVAGIEQLLRSLLSEDIHLAVVPDAGLGQVKADPGQIDQVLLNLVVNARDAMPEGGRLTIRTQNVSLEEPYTRELVGVEPGHYVMLVVTDTGCGMDKETLSRIFEPFFTTKERGKGTGLGLATVYGIVKQSGGEIRVYSEPGTGTAFRIYLPRVDEPVETTEEADAPAEIRGGTEVILLVEDDAAVRTAARSLLEDEGYTLLEAGNGEEALALSQGREGPIDLLLTDVVMPGMGGRQLADRLAVERPDTRAVFMSGYTEDAIVHHGVLDDGIFFLQKPFAPGVLLRKVREVLDRPPA